MARAPRLHADEQQGFFYRAARDLVDKLAEHDEDVTVFYVHDADAHAP
jgi:hypothetical protein